MIYVQLPDSNGKYNIVKSASYYTEGDRISLLNLDNKIVFAKNDEVIHMTVSPCINIPDCRINAFVSTHINTKIPPPIYFQDRP
jgi:hypothetical protein